MGVCVALLFINPVIVPLGCKVCSTSTGVEASRVHPAITAMMQIIQNLISQGILIMIISLK
jgi:hypothetical protein